MRFDTDQSLQYHILDLCVHKLKTVTLLLKCFLEHSKIPFGAVCSVATLLGLCIRVVIIIVIGTGLGTGANRTLRIQPLPLLSILVIVFDKLWILLVDRKVGQMHILLAQILGVIGVLLRGESHQAIIVHVDLEGIEATHQHIYAQVILKSIDKVRVGNVATG